MDTQILQSFFLGTPNLDPYIPMHIIPVFMSSLVFYMLFWVGGETLPLRFCVFAGILSGHGRLPWQE